MLRVRPQTAAMMLNVTKLPEKAKAQLRLAFYVRQYASQ